MRILRINIFLLMWAFVSLYLIIRLVDPWRVGDYFTDLNKLFDSMTFDSDRQYRNTPGEYQFSNWSATIDQYGFRVIPNNHDGSCSIALLGDSVAFGFGVDDNKTFINLLANNFVDVHFLNTGVIGYNIQQIVFTRLKTAANGYIYLLINNDADPMRQWKTLHPFEAAYASIDNYLYIYKTRIAGGGTGVKADYTSFDHSLISLKNQTNILTIGFKGDPLAEHAAVSLINNWTGYNSFADRHANADGNQQIADDLIPYLKEFIPKVCHA